MAAQRARAEPLLGDVTPLGLGIGLPVLGVSAAHEHRLSGVGNRRLSLVLRLYAMKRGG